MDHELLKQLRRNLTLHFAVIAWMTAMLVATGSGGYYLPAIVFLVSIVAFVFVDTLGWFELGKIGSYIGMSVVTCIAIGSYIYSVMVTNSESGQLIAVAGLLIYPECILFLQRKSLRVYEQLAIFLLLEMIVAALINDNLFFGLLLTPIMLLWVSSLFLFSRYATLVQVDPSIDEPLPILVELMYRRYVKPMLRETPKRPVVTATLQATRDVQATQFARRTMQTMPIGIGALVFAGIFFYLLPRTSPGEFRAGLGIRPSVGLPTELQMGLFGRLLQNSTPVMRVSLTSEKTGKPYGIKEPPYLRARVFDSYFPVLANGARREQPVWGLAGSHPFHPPLDGVVAVNKFARQGGAELVTVEFDIRREFASILYTVPPPFAPKFEQRIELSYDRFNMLLDPIESSNAAIGKSLVYSVGSAGFANNEQIAIMPAYLPRSWIRPISQHLSQPLGRFPEVDLYRRELLRNDNVREDRKFEAAKAYEKHFLYSGKFTYSLDLRPPQDPDMDPIEDFIINQPQGHCQYFASALVAMLRQNEIPSRIVVGYRPIEFNRFGYFPVKQSDAHAWVEALFSTEDLQGTEYERWLIDDVTHYWVRFDPTPSSSGGTPEIVEQRGQAMDYAEKLWKDYVVDAQKISGQNNIYAPVSGDNQSAYSGIIARIKGIATSLEQGRLGTRRIGFAWPLAIAIILLGAFVVGCWQLAVNLPRWAPKLAHRLGLDRSRRYEVKQAFFARCLRLLEQRGLRREISETPKEFIDGAAAELDKSATQVGPSLTYLTQLYYRLRFGSEKDISPDDARGIEEALRKVESWK